MPTLVTAEQLRNCGCVSRLLTLSMRHLPPNVVEDLQDSACAYINADCLAARPDAPGFFVWADRLLSEDGDETVVRLGLLAGELNCSYVFFDRDADPIEGLPVFKDLDDDVDLSDIPEADQEWFEKARLRCPD